MLPRELCEALAAAYSEEFDNHEMVEGDWHFDHRFDNPLLYDGDASFVERWNGFLVWCPRLDQLLAMASAECPALDLRLERMVTDHRHGQELWWRFVPAVWEDMVDPGDGETAEEGIAQWLLKRRDG